MTNSISSAVAIAACVNLLNLTPKPSIAAQIPNLAGTWTFNEEESDDPREQMGQGRGGARGRAGGREPGSGGAGRGGRGGAGPGRRPGGGDPQQMREMMQSVMRAAERMVLVQDDSSVTLTYSGGPSTVLITNGKKWKHELANLGEVEFKAEWKNEELRVERRFERGAKVRERYRRSEETDQLFVITQFEPGFGNRSLEFRRVYDREQN